MAADPLFLVGAHRHNSLEKKCASWRLEHGLRDAGKRGLCMKKQRLDSSTREAVSSLRIQSLTIDSMHFAVATTKRYLTRLFFSRHQGFSSTSLILSA